MNWIEVGSYAFYAFLMTTITGGVFTAVWLIFRMILGDAAVKLMDRCLRICIQTYVVPVLFLVMMIQHRDNFMQFSENGLVTGRLFRLSPLMQKLIAVLTGIWGLAILGTMVYWSVRKIRLERALAGSVPEDDPKALVLYERVRGELGIHRNIPLQRNDLFNMPFTAGVFRPKIVLPFEEYSEKELEVIFFHELIHCKRVDLFYKIESVFMNVFHAVNPFAYIARYYMSRYIEMACDAHVCDCGTARFTMNEYFKVILKLNQGEGRKPLILTAKTDKPSELERRVRVMKAYRKKGLIKKNIAMTVMAAFIIGSSMTAYAAGDEVTGQSAIREEAEESGEATVTVYFIPADQIDNDNIVIMGEEMEPNSDGVHTFNWYVPAGSKYCTTSFHLDNGTQLSIAVALDPDDKTVRAGLEYPNAVEYCVEGTEVLSYTFTASMSGGYRFYVENLSDTEVHAYGSYSYINNPISSS